MPATAFSVNRTTQISTVVASPDLHLRKRLLEQLSAKDHVVKEASGGAEALALIEQSECRTLLLDHDLPDLDSQELVATIHARHPQVRIVMLNSQAENEATMGRLEFPPNSHEPNSHEMFRLIQNAREPRIPVEFPDPTRQGSEDSRASSDEVEPLPGMTGWSASLRRVARLARLVAPRKTAVLLTGETGTGKELVAHGIHALSPRRDRPFVIINCTAIPEALLEAELFGYNRGAFTGAFQSRVGRIQVAHGGTLLLDEVGDLPLSMQAKFLRFLQEGEIQRLGGTDPLQIDARVIAATNADLPKLVKEGRFREDLYYRLSVFPIEIDPLRLRRDDIGPLSQRFLDLFSQQEATLAKTFSSAAASALQNYSWPGNVRELRQVVERAFILAESQQELQLEHFPTVMAALTRERSFRTPA